MLTTPLLHRRQNMAVTLMTMSNTVWADFDFGAVRAAAQAFEISTAPCPTPSSRDRAAAMGARPAGQDQAA